MMQSYARTREVVRLQDATTDRLRRSLKGSKKAARKAAIAAALTVPLTDKQKGQGRG